MGKERTKVNADRQRQRYNREFKLEAVRLLELGLKAQHRDIDDANGAYALREPRTAYTRDFGTEIDTLSTKNTSPWARSPVIP